MIIVRAPLRISFVGGGSDLPDFYKLYPGKVISATIDKYVYAVINPAPLLNQTTARYSIIENVKNTKDLKNNRIREVMLKLKVNDYMEINTFSDLHIGTGLGGSSAFTVALAKGLSTYVGRKTDDKEIAEMASDIEINVLKEPIGKQDQFASSFGGFNIFQFNPSGTVDIEPILLDYKKRIDLENHMLVFFTGITRQASSVLNEQKANIQNRLETIKSMVELVDLFEKKLMRGDFEALGKLLHENWIKKKALASRISNQAIDNLYKTGLNNGSWGGKLLGAGGGGCILFLVPLQKKEKIRNAIISEAKKLELPDIKEIPIKFVQSGVEIISNSSFN